MTLQEILHNINDHARTLLQLKDFDALDDDFTRRLREHILREEKENALRLQKMRDEDPYVVAIALDHSVLIQQMIEKPDLPAELTDGLLRHFQEEYELIVQRLSAAPAARNNRWTVGPLT